MRTARLILTGLVASVVAVADVPENLRSWQPWTLIAAAIAVGALISRSRSRPVGAWCALGAVAGVAVGAEMSGEAGHFSLGLYIVVAVLIADVARHAALRTVAATGLASLLSVGLSEGLADGRGPSDVAFVAMMWALAASIALSVRWWAAASFDRDERVRAGERERIARDLHDIVAHHVSAIAVTAEGTRSILTTESPAVDRSLQTINTAAVTALDEMRALVHILRDGHGSEPPRRLETLANAFDDGHPRVHVTLAGSSDEPPAAVASAIHRIAREAVTNSRRHAHRATRIDINVHHQNDHVILIVTDDGRGAPARSGDGYGIDGMAERAELLGGVCTAGPQPSGGWRVEARLPIEHTT